MTQYMCVVIRICNRQVKHCILLSKYPTVKATVDQHLHRWYSMRLE